MPGLLWTKVVWAPATQQLALHELQYVLPYIVINTMIDHKQHILVFLLHFSVALAQNTTGVTTATTAAAGGNGPLAPHMSPCALHRCIKWMGDNPPSKREYFLGLLTLCMALKTLQFCGNVS
jgi:hypothetical protein